LVLTKCGIDLTAESSVAGFGEHYPWKFWDTEKRGEFVEPLMLAAVVDHHTYFAYGLDEGKLEELQEEIRSNGKRSKGRQSFEIICTAIQSKDEICPTAFVAGQGLQISKHNFGTRRFIIVSILWSNTCTFSFLLMEHGEFDALDERHVDTSLDGILTVECFHFVIKSSLPISSSSFQSQASRTDAVPDAFPLHPLSRCLFFTCGGLALQGANNKC